MSSLVMERVGCDRSYPTSVRHRCSVRHVGASFPVTQRTKHYPGDRAVATLASRDSSTGKDGTLAPKFSASRGKAQGSRPSRNSHLRTAVVEHADSSTEDSEQKVSVDAQDSWINSALDSFVPAYAGGVWDAVRSAAVQELATLSMPTTRTESFRFTDISPLMRATLVHPLSAAPVVTPYEMEASKQSFVVMLDGVYQPELSNLEGLPASVFAGPMSSLPAETQERVSSLCLAKSDIPEEVFGVLNKACAADPFGVWVPAGVSVEVPLHVVYLSSSAEGAAELATSAPSLVVVAEQDSSVKVVEEYGAAGGGAGYFTTARAELVLQAGAAAHHTVLQRQAVGSVLLKATAVRQHARSSYSLVEVATGAALARHDLHMRQLGPETHTKLSSLLVVGEGQLSDLHSKLKLSHPEGATDQLHKCICAAGSARGVFDGNVQVEQLAQRTDAQQLSRNLLLSPKATVNVKPNLQIVADDVKCTHGCTVSDLEEEELFYCQARGIDAETARAILVKSFGQEIIQQLEYKELQTRTAEAVAEVLERGS